MPNNVALDFRSSSFDSVPARAQIAVCPDSLVEDQGIAGLKLAIGSHKLLRYLLDTLVQFAPKNLLNRTLRPGHTCNRDSAESAHLVQAHDFNLGITLRQFLADQWILCRRAPISLKRMRQLDEPADILPKNQVKTCAIGTALVHQRADCHIPSVIHIPEDVFLGHSHVTEKDFAELRFTGHLTQGAHLHALR